MLVRLFAPSLAAALSAVLAAPGALAQPSTFSTSAPDARLVYAMTVESGQSSFRMSNTRTVEPVTGADGTLHYRVIDKVREIWKTDDAEEEAPSTDAFEAAALSIDTVEVDALTRRPRLRSVGVGTMAGLFSTRMVFAPPTLSVVTGFNEGRDEMERYTVAFAGPVTTDGAALDLLLGVRPLAIGDTATFYAVTITAAREGELTPFPVTMRVEAAETVTVPAGTFAAFRVALVSEDRWMCQTIWVMQAAPHTVVRAVAPLIDTALSKDMMTVELVSR